MRRLFVALVTVFSVGVLTVNTAASLQADMPLLDSQYNCAIAQAQFEGGPQPATLGETLTVALGTECFLVVGVTAAPGDRLRLTYLSGQYTAVNLAFYEPSAPPGAAFGDPDDARLGTPTRAVTVPGSGSPRLILVALQGLGGPESGTAALRIDADTPPAPATTVTPTTTPPTTAVSTSAVPTSAVPIVEDEDSAIDDAGFPDAAGVEATEAVEDDSGFPDDPSTDDTSTEAAPAAEETEPGDTGSSPATDDSLPIWLILLTVAVAGGSAVWLMAHAGRRRRGAIVAPWDRPIVSWTMQHAAPTGSCSSNARALVDTNDDGSLEGYAVSALFTLPATEKRTRSTIGDPLLAQLENLWLTGGSGAELRSAVDSFVNNLCRKLDQKGTPTASTLLVELTKFDVAIDGDVHACTDGEWRVYPHWTQAPNVPADDHPRHDLVQVAALGTAESTAEQWQDRSIELGSVIAELIEERHAPVGLWVFD